MILFILLFSWSVWAEAPLHWANILEVNDRHEFYQNHEVIDKPADAWQTLFSLVYLDGELRKLKDCVYYRVPGKDEGVLKIKTMGFSEKCDDHILNQGDKEITGIKTLEFSVYDRNVTVNMNLSNFKTEIWESKVHGIFRKPIPEMSMSSVEFKSPKMIFLAPKTDIRVNGRESFLKDKTLCHDVNEDCQEVSKSVCNKCENGWYEVPNGCESGPKFCGPYVCGGKDQPACRRGMKWQKKDNPFDCRTDASYAYCSGGLKVVCEGQKAFCR